MSFRDMIVAASIITAGVAVPSNSPGTAESGQTRHLSQSIFGDVQTYISRQPVGSKSTRLPYNERMSESRHPLPLQIQQYLTAMRRQHYITVPMYQASEQAWRDIARLARGSLEVPTASMDDDGQIIFVWSTYEHHFEMELVSGTDTAELFYWNKSTDRTWEALHTLGNVVTTKAESYISHFSRVAG